MCDKFVSSSQLSSELGEIVKTTRGISTLKSASAVRGVGLPQYLKTREFVSVHSVAYRQKYIIRIYSTYAYLKIHYFN